MHSAKTEINSPKKMRQSLQPIYIFVCSRHERAMTVYGELTIAPDFDNKMYALPQNKKAMFKVLPKQSCSLQLPPFEKHQLYWLL